MHGIMMVKDETKDFSNTHKHSLDANQLDVIDYSIVMNKSSASL